MKIKVENGKVTQGRHELRDKISKLKDGYYNMPDPEPWKDSRSSQQNRLFWKIMTIVGEYCGTSKEVAHDDFVEMFAPIYTVKNIHGKPEQKKLTTSMMDTKQMYDFMQYIYQWCDEWQIKVPRPDDELVKSIMNEFDAVES